MITIELKAKCCECNEFSAVTKTSRTYTVLTESVKIKRTSPEDLVSPTTNNFFVCSLGCLIKFIAREADHDRL